MIRTAKEADLQEKLHAQQRRTRFERRRADRLFVQLTEATRKVGILSAGDPGAEEFLRMQERAATLASALQALINNTSKTARIGRDGAKHAQTILDTASAVPRCEANNVD